MKEDEVLKIGKWKMEKLSVEAAPQFSHKKILPSCLAILSFPFSILQIVFGAGEGSPVPLERLPDPKRNRFPVFSGSRP